MAASPYGRKVAKLSYHRFVSLSIENLLRQILLIKPTTVRALVIRVKGTKIKNSAFLVLCRNTIIPVRIPGRA
jgi:hypothetical protein